MSDAVLIQLADSVVADLNAATLSQTFTAVRKYRPPKSLEDVKSLTVLVVPGAVEQEFVSRNSQVETYRVDVAVAKKLDVPSTAGTNTIESLSDPLAYLVEEIKDLFAGARPSAYPTAICSRIVNDPAFYPDRMDDHRVFLSVIQLFYHTVR